MIYAEFRNRNFQPTLMPRLKYVPQRFSWQSVGGPENATIYALGSREQLYALLNCLRYETILRDAEGSPVWWGYIRSVVIYPEGYGATMEGMANRVRVDYMLKTPGRADRKTVTAFTQDDDSVTKYGRIERSFTLSQASAEHAAQYVATQLASLKKPLSLVEFGAEERLFAKIECRGWWASTGFQFYTRAESQQDLGTADTTLYDSFLISNYQSLYDQVAEPFIASTTGTINNIHLFLGNNGSPANMTVSIVNNGTGNHPTGSTLSSITFAWPPAMAWQYGPYALTTPVSVTAGNTYWALVYAPFNSLSGWYVMRWHTTTLLPAAQGSMQLPVGGTWINATYVANGVTNYWHMLTKLDYYIDNATQISDAVGSAAEFITGADIISTTGVKSAAGRAGDYTLQSALEELLTSGTSNNRQLLAYVTPERIMRVYEEPTPSRQAPGVYRDGNKLYDAQKRPLKANSPVGKWCRDVNIVLPPEAEIDPSFFFIARAEYDCRKEQWASLEARDQQQAFQLGALV